MCGGGPQIAISCLIPDPSLWAGRLITRSGYGKVLKLRWLGVFGFWGLGFGLKGLGLCRLGL